MLGMLNLNSLVNDLDHSATASKFQYRDSSCDICRFHAPYFNYSHENIFKASLLL